MIKLPTKTLSDEYVHVFSGDDAIDTEAPGFADGYRRALETGDVSLIPHRTAVDKAPSKVATITMRRFRGRQRRRFRGLMITAENREEAVFDAARAVLVGVEGLDLPIESSEWGDVLTEDALEQLDAIPGLLDEIAIRALEEHTLKKKS